MAEYEMYEAKADAQLAMDMAGTESPFTIQVRFLGGLTEKQKDAFKGAADRWTRIIIGDLASVTVDGELIDDVLIEAQGSDIDGPGGTLGMAGPRAVRPRNSGKTSSIPSKGIMTFDTADLKKMEQNGTLNDVITHEMGHVLGIGKFIWLAKGLLKGAGTDNPTFVGKNAMKEFGILQKAVGGSGRPARVPVANVGGQGTRDSHWREAVFQDELMSGIIAGAGNPISRMTVASLADLGYEVDMNQAEPYSLPNLHMIAAKGLLVAHEAPINEGVMLPVIPLEF